MDKKSRLLAQGAMIAAAYVALSLLQNLLLPGSATWAVQFRAAEALCVLAFFTPAAVPGLTVGCAVFNLTAAGALPPDFLVGSLATFLATAWMWLTRKWARRGLPLGLIFPVVTNAVLVGWELALCMGGGFALNALYVAVGEGAVMLTLGGGLYHSIRRRRLDRRLF